MILDANGIPHYEESDPASPFSDTLNVLADATSDKVEDIEGDLSTLFANFVGTSVYPTIGANWAQTDSTGHRPRIRRIGNLVMMTGAVTRQNFSGAVNALLIVPAGFRPSVSGTMFIGTSSFSAGGGTSGVAPLSMNTGTGSVALVTGYGTGSIGATSIVPVTSMWWVD